MKGYLANRLFSNSDVMFNNYLSTLLRENIEGLELYVPQEEDSINDKSNYASAEMIAETDTQKLLDSDVLIAVIDGDTIDAGVASEIGVFYTTGKPIIGLYSDIRQFGYTNEDKVKSLQEIGENQFHYVNLYVTGLIKLSSKGSGCVVNNIPSLLKEVNIICKELK